MIGTIHGNVRYAHTEFGFAAARRGISFCLFLSRDGAFCSRA